MADRVVPFTRAITVVSASVDLAISGRVVSMVVAPPGATAASLPILAARIGIKIADLALLEVTAVWGITFTVIKDALAGIGPYYFIGIRFSAAFFLLSMIYWKRLRNTNRKTLAAGLFIGLFLYAGYAFQTVGLKYTSASNAGFITGMAVVLVPLICAVVSRRLPGAAPATGVFSAALGLAALSLGDDMRWYRFSALSAHGTIRAPA